MGFPALCLLLGLQAAGKGLPGGAGAETGGRTGHPREDSRKSPPGRERLGKAERDRAHGEGLREAVMHLLAGEGRKLKVKSALDFSIPCASHREHWPCEDRVCFPPRHLDFLILFPGYGHLTCPFSRRQTSHPAGVTFSTAAVTSVRSLGFSRERRGVHGLSPRGPQRSPRDRNTVHASR